LPLPAASSKHFAGLDIPRDLVARVLHDLERAASEVDRLVTLIAGLHDVARIQGRCLSLQRSPVDVAALTRDAVERFGATAVTYALAFTIDATAA